MIINNSRIIYLAASALFAVAGCSRSDEAGPAGPVDDAVMPKTFTEARKMGMVDKLYEAELRKMMKEEGNPVISLNDACAAKEREIAQAKAAKAAKDRIDALQRELQDLKVKAAEAQKEYSRKMHQKIRSKMRAEREQLKKANLKNKPAQENGK